MVYTYSTDHVMTQVKRGNEQAIRLLRRQVADWNVLAIHNKMGVPSMRRRRCVKLLLFPFASMAERLARERRFSQERAAFARRSELLTGSPPRALLAQRSKGREFCSPRQRHAFHSIRTLEWAFFARMGGGRTGSFQCSQCSQAPLDNLQRLL